jgi:hypothetical protein
VFAIARRRGIRPITIGRQLVATMDDIALSNNGEVPSTYKVCISPSNLELLSPTLKPLAHELRQAVTHHANNEGYLLAGEPIINFDHAENLGQHDCIVTPSAISSVPKEQTEIAPVQQDTHTLVLQDDARHELSNTRYTIGRQTTCDIVISDNNVSRVHAELRFSNNTWSIEDRGSTNGTRINGNLIVEPTQLTPGDAIGFGSVTIHFE